MSPNIAAFLSLISFSEGTDRASDPYRVCFGFRHTIADLSNHPAITGEWHGEPLDFLGPAYKGLVSTAAGRYQITRPTWLRLSPIIHASDFTAPWQDSAALELIREKNALVLIDEGNIADAISACRSIWASLPGGSSGQPQKTVTELFAAFTGAGGTLNGGLNA